MALISKNVRQEISGRLKRNCVLCSEEIRVIVYPDDSYRAGHYFGRNGAVGEYWECPDCYWNK